MGAVTASGATGFAVKYALSSDKLITEANVLVLRKR